MHCRDIMKRQVICLSAHDSVQSAARKMRDARVGFLPVCDPSTHLVIGTITDRDIAIRLVAEDRPASTRITAVMTPEVVSVSPDDDLITAERAMARHQKSRLVCVDATGMPVGVISLSDIARKDRGAMRVAETMRAISLRESTTH